jgi:hypothetical protein
MILMHNVVHDHPIMYIDALLPPVLVEDMMVEGEEAFAAIGPGKPARTVNAMA